MQHPASETCARNAEENRPEWHGFVPVPSSGPSSLQPDGVDRVLLLVLPSVHGHHLRVPSPEGTAASSSKPQQAQACLASTVPGVVRCWCRCWKTTAPPGEPYGPKPLPAVPVPTQLHHNAHSTCRGRAPSSTRLSARFPARVLPLVGATGGFWWATCFPSPDVLFAVGPRVRRRSCLSTFRPNHNHPGLREAIERRLSRPRPSPIAHPLCPPLLPPPHFPVPQRLSQVRTERAPAVGVLTVPASSPSSLLALGTRICLLDGASFFPTYSFTLLSASPDPFCRRQKRKELPDTAPKPLRILPQATAILEQILPSVDSPTSTFPSPRGAPAHDRCDRALQASMSTSLPRQPRINTRGQGRSVDSCRACRHNVLVGKDPVVSPEPAPRTYRTCTA